MYPVLKLIVKQIERFKLNTIQKKMGVSNMTVKNTINDFNKNNPKDCRKAIREGLWTKPTAKLSPGFTQVNVLAIPKKYAFDFLLFCQRNPKPCPLLEVIEDGKIEAKRLAPGSNILKEIPKYQVFKNGIVEEMRDISDIWRDDFVTFLIGCSFSFEGSLIKSGVPIKHIQEEKNVPMYITNKLCDSAGPFFSNIVVSMRPIPANLVHKAVQITTKFPGVHGAPIHIGDPSSLGIKKLEHPDFGDSVTIQPDEVPVFWACGVTSQIAIQNAKCEIAISHSPGHMFITDIKDEEYAIF